MLHNTSAEFHEELDLSDKTIEIWPTLREEAFHGLAGEIIRANDPFTEADPAAVLINFLTAFGNCIGPTAHFSVEHKPHFLRLFVCLVGKSSVGKKGTSWGTPELIFRNIDEPWSRNRVANGLSSGEGLIHEVRDPQTRTSKDGKVETIDEGIQDKRLLVIEEEFAQTLKVLQREGNTLSTILRQAWDKGDLRTMTRNNPLRATGGHVSVIGHIVREELLKHLSDTEQGNGFGNRFLWFLVKRSKMIPSPTGVPLNSLNSLISQVEQAIEFSRKVGTLSRDKECEEKWQGIYAELTKERPGLIGSLLARSHVQVLRLSSLYALLDQSDKIRIPHLFAGISLMDYAEESVKIIFGDSLGDSYADRIHQELKDIYPEGLSETDIWSLFGRHGGNRVRTGLRMLQTLGYAEKARGPSSGGRPPVIWKAANKAKEANKVLGGGL